MSCPSIEKKEKNFSLKGLNEPFGFMGYHSY